MNDNNKINNNKINNTNNNKKLKIIKKISAIPIKSLGEMVG